MRMAYVNADCGIPVFGDKGACVHIQEMVRALQMRGAEVRIVATRLGAGHDSAIANGAVHAFRNRDGVLKDGGRSAKELANAADAEAVRDCLIQLHADWPYDMIYERYSLWSQAGVEAARALGVPLIVEVNAPLLLEQQAYRQLENSALAARIEKAVFTQADGIITVSSRLRDYVISRGASPGRTVAVGNAVDLSRFCPSAAPRDFGISPDAFVIGFTGSLKAWHGVSVMLEAFAMVHKANPRSHLLVVGDGPERGWIEGYVRGARLDGAVTVTGWMSHADLPSALTAMDVAIAPYPDSADFYFSPLKLFEYLAAGRAVVASAIGQIADVIQDGESGLLVAPGDAAALATALLAVNNSPALRLKLERGAAAEGSRHSWTRNADIALELGRALRKAA